VWQLEGNRILRKYRHKLEDNIKIDIKNTGRLGVRHLVGSFEGSNEHSNPVECGEFLAWLSMLASEVGLCCMELDGEEEIKLSKK
jgi:hypothetical protein